MKSSNCTTFPLLHVTNVKLTIFIGAVFQTTQKFMLPKCSRFQKMFLIFANLISVNGFITLLRAEKKNEYDIMQQLQNNGVQLTEWIENKILSSNPVYKSYCMIDHDQRRWATRPVSEFSDHIVAVITPYSVGVFLNILKSKAAKYKTPAENLRSFFHSYSSSASLTVTSTKLQNESLYGFCFSTFLVNISQTRMYSQ